MDEPDWNALRAQYPTLYFSEFNHGAWSGTYIFKDKDHSSNMYICWNQGHYRNEWIGAFERDRGWYIRNNGEWPAKTKDMPSFEEMLIYLNLRYG